MGAVGRSRRRQSALASGSEMARTDVRDYGRTDVRDYGRVAQWAVGGSRRRRSALASGSEMARTDVRDYGGVDGPAAVAADVGRRWLPARRVARTDVRDYGRGAGGLGRRRFHTKKIGMPARRIPRPFRLSVGCFQVRLATMIQQMAMKNSVDHG